MTPHAATFGGSAPYIVTVEQFVGPRIYNTDNGQIVQRLRIGQNEAQMSM